MVNIPKSTTTAAPADTPTYLDEAQHDQHADEHVHLRKSPLLGCKFSNQQSLRILHLGAN